MPKYYCFTADFKTIVDAPDIDVAVDKAIKRLIDQEKSFGFIMGISEIGFLIEEAKFISMIPLLRRAGIQLLPEQLLIEKVCKILHKDINTLGDNLRRWFFGRK